MLDVYVHEPNKSTRECADFEYRNRTCKHIRRVRFSTGRRELPEWIDEAVIDEQLGKHVHIDSVRDENAEADR